MYSILIVLILGAVASAQHPQSAAILSDSRYQSGDGTFGASYSQDDGITFKEESDAHGNRKGSYSYVDNGHRRTVFYTAGVAGFQATGDGIPKASPQIPPQPEYEPLPQYNPPDYRPPPRTYPQYRPPVPNQDPPVYQTRPAYSPPPQVLAHVPQSQPPRPPPRPRVPYKPKYQPQYQQEVYQPKYVPEPEYQPEIYQKPYKYVFEPATVPPPPPPPPPAQYNEATTPPPRRFYPSGKLDFTRTPDGFSYSFNKS